MKSESGFSLAMASQPFLIGMLWRSRGENRNGYHDAIIEIVWAVGGSWIHLRSFINFLFHEFNLSAEFYPRDHLSASGAGVEGRGEKAGGLQHWNSLQG